MLITDPANGFIYPVAVVDSFQVSQSASGESVNPGASDTWVTLLSSTSELVELVELELVVASHGSGEAVDFEVLDGDSVAVYSVQIDYPVADAHAVFANLAAASALMSGAVTDDYGLGRSIITRGV